MGFNRALIAFHQSVGELFFYLNFVFNKFIKFWSFGFPDFICNTVSVVYVVFMINNATCRFKFISLFIFLSQYTFFILLINHFGSDCLNLIVLF